MVRPRGVLDIGQETLRVVQSYLADGHMNWLAEVIDFIEPATQKPHIERVAVHEWQARFCNTAFSEVRIEKGSTKQPSQSALGL